MITCYPIWTHATPTIRRAIHRIARHVTRHAVMSTVRIVCVSVPAWLAVPAPAAAPPVPDTGPIMPPPMLPWPEDGEVPWGWVPTDTDQFSRRLSTMRTTNPEHRMEPVTTGSGEQTGFTNSDVGHTDQPVPEPAGVGVMGVGMIVLGLVRRWSR